jgi:hypothetical protein
MNHTVGGVSKRRKALQTLRIFQDQFVGMQKVRVTKYRGRLTVADLVREAVDQYLERELPVWKAGR